MSLLGNRVVRTEDRRLVTGAGKFVGNVELDHMGHVVFVRSTIAHATITNIDTAEAVECPGVLAVVTAADLGVARMKPRVNVDESVGQPLLAADKVRFVGEPVAAVVAESLSQALDAAEAVSVEFEPLTPVVALEHALEGTSLLFDQLDSNILTGFPRPAEELDFSKCEVVVEAVVVNQRMAAAPIEARVGVADWTGDRLTVWASCQGAGVVKEAIKAIHQVNDEDVRVLAPDIGGGFGAKGGPHAEELVLPALSRIVNRPVRWAETRTENLLGMVHGRGQRQQIKIGGTRSGKISHYALHVDQDSGAYPDIGGLLPTLTMMMQPGTYDIANVQFSSHTVVTNTTPVGAFRGAGRPEAAAAIERAMDLFAAKIQLDPADLRRQNLIPAFSEPYRNAMGTNYDVGDYRRALETVLEAADYNSLRREQSRRRGAGENSLLGIGLASYVEITAIGGPDGISEFGSVELLDDGSILALTGSTPQGQGHETAWAMLVADELGISMDRVSVVYGDTDLIPSTNVTGGSRSAQIAGSSIKDASVQLVRSARGVAAELLEANPEDLTLDTSRGVFHVVGTPSITIDWTAIAEATKEPLLGSSQFVQGGSSFPFGAHVAVVEVDAETGAVQLIRHFAVDDCGTIVNALLADGQVHGGLASGAAQALLEEVAYDEQGTPITSNFADYGVISAPDLPSFDRIEMVTPTPLNPIGAKGIGESATIGSTPAVQNAVIDAVAHLGVRHIDMPCTAEKVWRAMQESTGETSG